MQLVMPKLGLTMTEATLTRWYKAAGDEARQGEILFEFESEKSVMEYESPADGRLAQILVKEGETVPCGTPVAVFEPATAGRPAQVAQQPARAASEPGGAPVIAPRPHQGEATKALSGAVFATPAAKRRARELGVNLATVAGRGPQGRVQLEDVELAAQTALPVAPVSPAVTPVARRMAAELGVDLAHVSGSGPGGRVVKEDVRQAVPARPEPAAAAPGLPAVARVQPLSGVRGVIARRMSDSAFTAPHVTLFTDADATALVEARAQINLELAGRVKISYNALLVAIIARLLPEHPGLNACLVNGAIHYYQDVNVALAVDTERGLLVPVIRRADQLDLISIQQTGDSLIERAMAGQSGPDDLAGGTFTITNLGMFDVDGFTPIINQPQSAILGVGRIEARPVAVDNEVKIRQMLTLSLSFDHRIVDGGPAARFLQRVRQLIERPFSLVIPAGSR